MVANIVRMCNDGNKEHGEAVILQLQAEEHFKKAEEELRVGQALLVESYGPSLKAGGGFSAIRHYVYGAPPKVSESGRVTVETNLFGPPLGRKVPMIVIGVICLLVGSQSPATDSTTPPTTETTQMSTVRDHMIADAKTCMVRKDVKRETALSTAESILDRVRQQFGLDPDSFGDLCFCKFEAKKYDEVLSLCAEAEKQGPTCHWTHTYRGRVLLAKGKKVEARAEFERASAKGDTKAYIMIRQTHK